MALSLFKMDIFTLIIHCFFQLFQPDFAIFFNFSNFSHANQIKCFKGNYNPIIPVDIRILDLDRF